MRLLLLSVFIIPIYSNAQLTWADGAAELFYENCTVCHNGNGIAPFSLMEYDQVSDFSSSISAAIDSDYMPPWTADDGFSGLAHSRALEPLEKESLLTWLEEGAPSGDLATAPPEPIYENQGFIQTAPDLVTEMEPHTSTATLSSDDYICVSIPTGLLEDKKIRGFEVIPGNPSILHHCLVYIDQDGTSESDFSGVCGGPNNDQGLIGGYAPGAFPTIFPSDGEDMNMGITLNAGSKIILALHYPHGSLGEVDQTKVNFYFYEDDTEIREVSTFPLLQNWEFQIPADSQTEVQAQFGPTQADFSFFSVFPHMHLVGEFIESFAVTQENETIPFVRIPHWDFEWQEFYFFQNLQVVPAGSQLYANGTFNNTAANPHNPNNPPQDIFPGLNTTDEMFLVYFHFMQYEEGDEDLDIENLIALSSDELDVENFGDIKVFPNPADAEVNLDLNLTQASNVSLYIYDTQGKLVDKLLENMKLAPGDSQVVWDVSKVNSGIYFYSVRIDGVQSSGRISVK